MNITIETLKNITLGVENISEEDGFIVFSRFTEDEKRLYEEKKSEIASRAIATASVRLACLTDAERLSFDYKTILASSRTTCGYFDLYQDGYLTHHVGEGTFSGEVIHVEVELKKGVKRVELYFPWSVNALLKNISFDGATLLEPVKREKTLLAFGDSITHGYTALFPSLSYINTLGRLLSADVINKGVGGEVFFPELVGMASFENVDVVTVAYGTNDWSKCYYDDFYNNCSQFLKILSEKAKGREVYVITPIWRKTEESAVGAVKLPHEEMHREILKIASDYPSFHVIDGMKLTPHVEDFFEDKYLHPNDLGFQAYASNLYKEIIDKRR